MYKKDANRKKDYPLTDEENVKHLFLANFS